MSVNPRTALDLGVRCKLCGGNLALERLRCVDCGEPHAGVDPDAALEADVRCRRCYGELAWAAEGRFAPARHDAGERRSAAATRAGAR